MTLSERTINILAEFEKGFKPGDFELADMADDLSPILNYRKINISNAEELIGYRREQLTRGAQAIYCKDVLP